MRAKHSPSNGSPGRPRRKPAPEQLETAFQQTRTVTIHGVQPMDRNSDEEEVSTMVTATAKQYKAEQAVIRLRLYRSRCWKRHQFRAHRPDALMILGNFLLAIL